MDSTAPRVLRSERSGRQAADPRRSTANERELRFAATGCTAKRAHVGVGGSSLRDERVAG